MIFLTVQKNSDCSASYAYKSNKIKWLQVVELGKPRLGSFSLASDRVGPDMYIHIERERETERERQV